MCVSLKFHMMNSSMWASFTKKCQEMGIYIQHEKQYHLNKQHNQDAFIRLGFAGMSESKFACGIELLVHALWGKGK